MREPLDPRALIIPSVIEQTPRGERVFDIYSRLLKDRIVFIGSPIDDLVSNLIIAQLLHLQGEDPTEKIDMYINSPGGITSAGLAIYDTMQYISPEVHTWCVGQAASMAAVLLTAGAPGHRAALPYARILIHQPFGGVQGQASDIEIQAREIIRIRKWLNEILSKHTGKPLERIEQDTDRDYYMTAEEALQYGLIDFIAEPQHHIEE
ncbi:MAG: ATP-dependent Clp protease proteolytic subunit [Armatimonadetes bacterium]|nr:ATP-dependent Clp protease proteolytic subunit [Armatimonadota bacterium]